MSDNVLSFKETEIAKSVCVHAILNRRLGTRRYDIGFPNVLITVFLFPVAISFLSHRREGDSSRGKELSPKEATGNQRLA